jgi:hypothetical protein
MAVAKALECSYRTSESMATRNRNPETEALEVVFLGAFNPAIFHPEWFLRQKLVGADDVQQSVDQGLVKVVSNDVTEIQLCGIKLLCLSERLSLGTSNISNSARLQDLILHIFNLLPHIPLTACGINNTVDYSLTGELEYWHKIGHTLAPKELIWNDLFNKPGMLSLTINAIREGDFPGQTNARVEPSVRFAPGIFIAVNYHYPVVKTGEDDSTERVSKFLQSEWDAASKMPKLVAQKIFDKIKPDDE